MNIHELQQLDRLQQEVFCRINSDPFFSDVAVFPFNKGLTRDQVFAALGALNTKAGKAGAAVIVMLPDFASSNSNSSGLQGSMVSTVRVLEMPNVNLDPETGTGKTASMLALRVARVIQGYTAGGVFKVGQVDDKAIAEYAADIDQGIIGYDVTHNFPGGLTGGDKVMRPVITVAADVTIATSTPDATIWYTLDGTYPGSGNSAATQYTGAFAVPADGTTIRAGAEHPALVPADTAFITL